MLLKPRENEDIIQGETWPPAERAPWVYIFGGSNTASPHCASRSKRRLSGAANKGIGGALLRLGSDGIGGIGHGFTCEITA